jgi:hypothetical protein
MTDTTAVGNELLDEFSDDCFHVSHPQEREQSLKESLVGPDSVQGSLP